jgi:predicted PurR-regulated permease PerM
VLKTLPFRIRLPAHRLFEDINATLAAYMRAQLLACVIVGCLCGLGFALLGVPYALLLGLVAGVLEFVPLLGPLVVAIAAVALAAFHGPTIAWRAAGLLAVLRVVQDNVIYPRLIGRDIELHPLAVILAVLAGLELGGVAGVFVAVPLVAIASVAVRHWLVWRTPDADTAPGG